MANAPKQRVGLAPNTTVIDTQSIVRIQDVFDRWRQMGTRRLGSGTELIGRMPDSETELWMHAIYPGLTVPEIELLEVRMQRRLPRDLRALYRISRGMSLFQGAFRLLGRREPGFSSTEQSLQPDDILELNHELDVLGWKPKNAVAFAVNAWDQSVHLFGMTQQQRQIARCDRATGTILELNTTLWDCLVAKLYKLDQLLVKE